MRFDRERRHAHRRRQPRAVASPDHASRRKLKAFVLRKDGHTYCFCYPAAHECAALKAAADCGGLETIDVVALACYLGHDPRELGLTGT